MVVSCHFILTCCLMIGITEALISQSFYNYMKETRGRDFAEGVARKDFGVFGSFGGGTHKGGTPTKHRPTIFVHGWLFNAAAYQPLTGAWLINGYGDEELYGTSYGDPVVPGGLGITETQEWSMKCAYIKQVRNLIVAVADYTNSTVNVIGYSLGGPVSRKAILGGKCVDTKEDLGPPLTPLVDTYLGVAGAMKGAILCPLVIVPTMMNVGICNHNNGIGCDSDFIKDIHSQTRYEAHRKIYVLQTVTDNMVGYWMCGTHPSEVPGADKTVTLFGYLHIGLVMLTPMTQFKLINEGVVDVPKQQKFMVT